MKIINISPSYYWSNVLVIETECGHRHLRPIDIIKHLKVGDNYICFCEEDKLNNGAK